MNVQEIMTADPACCTGDFTLENVARLMVDNDCGCIPVVDNLESCHPIGVITDRDIICRALAAHRDPLELTAAQCMSHPCITIDRRASIDECCELLEQKQIRRVPVIDEGGSCCGIVAQADIAECAAEPQVAEVLRRVSEPTGSPSNV